MKIESKMTAIEWLEMEFVKLEAKYGIPGEIYQLCEKAKEIEKQQIIDAYSVGYITDFKLNSDYTTQTPEQYYNETFNNEN